MDVKSISNTETLPQYQSQSIWCKDLYWENLRYQNRDSHSPENFALMPENDNDYIKFSENLDDGQIQNYISDLARRYKLWIVAGTIQSNPPIARE